MFQNLLASFDRIYRRTGANVPFGDARASHGALMEGYFWRFTDAAEGRVVVALCGVNRHADGDWATVALATHPKDMVRSAVVPFAAADRDRLEVTAGDVVSATETSVHFDLGAGARLDATIDDAVGWPHRTGAGGVFSVVPFLSQYWHPHILGARASGTVVTAGDRWALDGATVYAEKNWGRGFPKRWWWGQAQAFEGSDVCVAFGGGELEFGPRVLTVGGVVVRIGADVLRFAPPFASVRAVVTGGSWSIHARRPGWDVVIEGDGSGSKPHVLPVPVPAERRNIDTDYEHLAARMRLTVRRKGRVVLDDTSRLAGLEVGSLDGSATA